MAWKGVSKYLQVYRWPLSKASCKEQTQKLVNFGWENWRRETHGLQFLLNVVGVFCRRKCFGAQIRLGKPWLDEVTCVLSLQDFSIPLLCLYPTREEVSMQHFRFFTWTLSPQSISGSRIPKLYFWTSDPWSLIWYEALHWGLSTKHMGTWFPSREKKGWFPSSPPPTPCLCRILY